MTYLGTNALIKRFVMEKGSPLVTELFRGGRAIATGTIAYAEVYSGLTRRHREGHISRPHYAALCREFEQDWTTYIHVELQPEVLTLARDLIQRHALRSFDAIHLSSALRLQGGLREELAFMAADDRLLRAAKAERLQVLNPEAAEAL